MNRTDRLLAIVLELQAKVQIRAEDLAATFEVSKRTIYRDIEALAESGVPIIAIPGQGYSLMEGYFLPPLTFTSDEALMLLLGNDFVAQNFGDHYRGVAQSSSRKLRAVLPEPLRREIDYVESSMQFVAVNGAFALETLHMLRQALLQHRTVRFRYHTRSRDGQPDTTSVRDVDPYGLIYVAGAWVLVAYCHLRRDIRNFRLDRMDEVEILNKSFTRPADFVLQRDNDENRTVMVRVLFDHETARWTRETSSFFQVSEEPHPDGLLVTLMVQHIGEVLNWLLSWGSHVRVLEPEALRDMLVREARGILVNYSI